MTQKRPGSDGDARRRTVLKGVGTAVAVGSVGVAGCTATLPPLGQRVRFGRVEAPPRNPPVYRDWIPQPGVLQAGDDTVDPLGESVFVTPGDTNYAEIAIGDTIGETLMRHTVDYFGPGFDSYDWAFTPGEGVVLAGRIDRDVVRETVTDTLYEAAESYRGFDHYRRTDETHHLAVSDSHLVFDTGEHAWENVTQLVDAGTGRAQRYTDANETASRFVDAVGSSQFTWYGAGSVIPESLADEVETEPDATAMSFFYDDGAAYYVYESIYPAGSVPSKPVVEDWVEEFTRAVEAVGVEVTVDGRLVTAAMRYPAEEVTDDQDQPFVLPQVTWSSEYDPDENQLRVTHHAGDSVAVDRVGVDLSDGSGSADLSPQSGTIGPGDDLTVDLSASKASRVRLYLESRDGDTTSVLYSTDLPEG